MRQLLLPFYQPFFPAPERAVLTLLHAALNVTEHAMRDAHPLVGSAVGELQRDPTRFPSDATSTRTRGPLDCLIDPLVFLDHRTFVFRDHAHSATAMGRTTFAILLFQDIAAIPLIGLVPLLAEGRSGTQASGALAAGKVVAAIAVVALIGRYLTRPALRIVSRTELRELFTAFALLLVVGIAQLMAAAGVSMALGAFLAGVLLASSEYRHALETDIEPFRGLLMGLSFMAVGMSIDFGLFARKPFGVLLVLAAFLIAKALSLRAIARPLDISLRQRWLFSALLGQGGEFAFVVFGVAGKARLLPGDWDALFTLVVALSMATTPIMLLVLERLTAQSGEQAREYDAIDTGHAQVIMAGFGR